MGPSTLLIHLANPGLSTNSKQGSLLCLQNCMHVAVLSFSMSTPLVQEPTLCSSYTSKDPCYFHVLLSIVLSSIWQPQPSPTSPAVCFCSSYALRIYLYSLPDLKSYRICFFSIGRSYVRIWPRHFHFTSVFLM